MRRWAVPGPLLLVLAVAAGITASVAETGHVLGALGMVVGQLTAARLLWTRSPTLGPAERNAWRVFAAGLVSVATGVVVVGVLSELGVVVPAVGPADTFFLAGYVLLVVTLIKLARTDEENREWLPTILDAAVAAIALSVLVWTFFYRDLIDAVAGASPWEAAVAMTYPILDIAAVIALMIMVNRRSHFRGDLRLRFLAVGLSIQVFADFLFLRGGIDRPFSEVQPNYPMFLVATMAYLTAAALVDRAPERREFPDRESRLLSLVWPYLLACALLVTHVVQYRSVVPGGDRVLLLDALLAIGGVIFLRQVYMIHRNRTRVDRQRSDLVASVSHELRTPLTAMVGYLSLLDDRGDEFPEEARREMLAEATDQAKHISRLVSDLVLVARGSTPGQLPLEIADAKLAELMQDALLGIDTENARISDDVDEGILLRVDADRLRQAVANLVSNAIRYGGDHCLIRGYAVGADLVIEVHDSGPGVPTRHENTIWERFERGANRFNAVSPGMGIGLAIVRAIAAAHGGTSGYRRSEELGGACFSISIPDCVTTGTPREPVTA